MLEGWIISGCVRLEADALGVEFGLDVAVGEKHVASLSARGC